MTIGSKIKELRLEKRMFQMQLAKLIGVIDYWERGVNEPRASFVVALVKVFEISYDEFF